MAKGKQRLDAIHAEAAVIVARTDPGADPGEANYVFLSFVRTYLPAGLIGLLFACVFAASMSSSSGELSALATISIIDVYRRFVRRDASERHYLVVSRLMMAFWGLYGIAFAQYASHLGSLIEAVNILGSLFYGTMLGLFLLAFYGRSVGGTAALAGGIAGEAAVLCCFFFTDIAWLWYNVIGCAAVIAVAFAVTGAGIGRPSRGGLPREARPKGA